MKSVYSAIAGGAISGGFGLLGSYLQSKYNMELAQYQNQMNIEQWERENEYNKPINQMRRLEEAGINPNLAYSNGSISNTSATSPNLTAGEPANYQSAFSGIGAGARLGIDFSLALLDAQKKNLENEGLATQNELRKVLLNRANELFDLDFNTSFDADGNSYEFGKRLRDFQKTDTDIQLSLETINKTTAQIDQIAKETQLTTEQLNQLIDFGPRVKEAELQAYADRHNLDVTSLKKAVTELKYLDATLTKQLTILTNDAQASDWKPNASESRSVILKNEEQLSKYKILAIIKYLLGNGQPSY